MSKPMLRRCQVQEKMPSSSQGNLCYTDDSLPGITRKRKGDSFMYFDTDGKHITNKEQITRLNKIGLPPAYKDSWLCPSPHGHIQAIGYDKKGRKQYRYHTRFSAAQDADKFNRCVDFGKELPLIRSRVEYDLAKDTLKKDTVTAAIIRLLDLGHVRVGNQVYEKTNNSFGATTLLHHHAAVKGNRLSLEYRGKSGQPQHMIIEDARLSCIARKCQDLPGQNLFQYIDDNNAVHPVTSSDVNDYIRNTIGKDFSAKHFRTWGANVVAYKELVNGSSAKDMILKVSHALGNTPAIARKAYLHPAIIALSKTKGIQRGKGKVHIQGQIQGNVTHSGLKPYLNPAELGLIAFLESHKVSKPFTVTSP
jgi:DNA topoisomerase-1